jgi:aryl-alcohol dehydrogenase-like predicted oxidoreductase
MASAFIPSGFNPSFKESEMHKRPLGNTGIDIVPLVFGGNVFGWTIDEKTSFAVLDAFVDHGFNAIDTADVYSAWADGNQGGESETIIGRWLKARPGVREKVAIFTKVGADMGGEGNKGLASAYIPKALDASLARLDTDHIDLYFSHWPDPQTPYAETLGAYDAALKAGKIRSVGASNLDAAQLQESLKVAKEQGLPAYQVLQPEYNLYDRGSFDGTLRETCIANNIGVVTYYSLASGFLSGKYRSQADLSKSTRGQGIAKYLDKRGLALLDALDGVAAEQGAKPAEVALAWLIAREGVTAPIASATSVAQVESFAKAATLKLSPAQLQALSEV